jgi:hypothetical protein
LRHLFSFVSLSAVAVLSVGMVAMVAGGGIIVLMIVLLLAFVVDVALKEVK